MNVAFNINSLVLMGLGVTISSLIRNCSDSKKLKLWFLCAHLTDYEKNQITHLLESESFSGEKEYIDFDPLETFGAFPSLHGDWTAYGRLLLADFIMDDQVLYLDADLLIEVDVLEVANFEFNNQILAAVGGGLFKNALGKKFYINQVGLSPELEYFNSGIVLFNLAEWRKQNIKDECLRLAKLYSEELPSHDQSILNLICSGNFAKLPNNYNCRWLATSPRPTVASKMILHFVGSPKPWDLFGSLIHNGYSTWKMYLPKDWDKAFGRFEMGDFVRAWKIRKSYIRSILVKIKR